MDSNGFLFSDDGQPGSFQRQKSFFDTEPLNKSANPPKQNPPKRNPPKQQQPAKANGLSKKYSVTQLTRLIKLAIANNLPGKITVEGEISNFKHHGSGHLYLTLKDANSQIPAVMWKSAAGKVKFSVADGMAVVATGHIDIYEPQGKYQFYIDKLEPVGKGALELALRELAEKLRKEELFASEHKKPLPPYPATIAIVTSGTGAAIEDISKTLHRRYPIARKLLMPVAVQGENAAPQIARAITELNKPSKKLGPIDVIIVARGGGSIEDLWAFNEEIVARAIFASKIPIVTGIGHEIDVTIADMVSDKRAATPTAAAEIAVPVLDELLNTVSQWQLRLGRAINQRHNLAVAALRDLSNRPIFARPFDVIHFKQQQLDELTSRLTQRLTVLLTQIRRQLESDTAILRQIEPHAALARASSRLSEQTHMLQTAMREQRRHKQHQLDNTAIRLRAASPLRQAQNQRVVLTELTNRVSRALKQFVQSRQQQLDTSTKRLESLNPRAVLGRGYSITRIEATNAIITAKNIPQPDDIITTELADNATIHSKVTKKNSSE